MSGPRAFVTRQLVPQSLEYLAQHTDLEVWPEYAPPTPEQLREKLATAEGVLTNIMDRVDPALFDAAPNLKIVSQMAAGLDNVDVAEATRRNVLVGYTPGVVSKATADTAFAVLLAAARRVGESERWVRAGEWQLAFHPLNWLGMEVHEATLGIIGMGQIGLEMAKRARGFDMRIIYSSRTRRPELEAEYGLEYVSKSDLLAQADFVSLHVPLTPETRHYIGEAELQQMKPTAVLVNASRGPVVDTQALYTALKEGWIYAAGLDVVDPEPIPADHPLLGLENVVIVPHIGSSTHRTRTAMCMMAARNLVLGLQGQRLEQCANPDLYAQRGI